jgi:hypothetical protein
MSEDQTYGYYYFLFKRPRSFRKAPVDRLKQITAPMQIISLNAGDTPFE